MGLSEPSKWKRNHNTDIFWNIKKKRKKKWSVCNWTGLLNAWWASYRRTEATKKVKEHTKRKKKNRNQTWFIHLHRQIHSVFLTFTKSITVDVTLHKFKLHIKNQEFSIFFPLFLLRRRFVFFHRSKKKTKENMIKTNRMNQIEIQLEILQERKNIKTRKYGKRARRQWWNKHIDRNIYWWWHSCTLLFDSYFVISFFRFFNK